MALLGHRVTIFEAGPKLGGMIRYGVPVFRYDQAAFDLEIQAILDMGVEVKLNTPIGKKIKLADLRRDFDAVYLGLGLMKGRLPNIEGVTLDGVISAVDLLLNYNMGYKVELGRRVLVVGGGDVAMDAARTALRLGQITADQRSALGDTAARTVEENETVHTALDVARTALRLGVGDVRMIALESWDELPASAFEIEEALEEGIHIFPRHGPNRIIGAEGKVAGVEVIAVQSVFDRQGRFAPKFKPGSEAVWTCDTVILAIGQTADLDALGGADDIELTPRGFVQIDPANGQTTAPGVFAGGDIAYGPHLLIDAVKHGHIAALGMEQHLQNRRLRVSTLAEWTALPNHAMFENWCKLERRTVPSMPVNRRTGISVVDLGYSEAEAVEQGTRCLECSVNTIFDGSQCILCNGCVDVCPWDCLKIVSPQQVTGDERLRQVIEHQLGAPLETAPDNAAVMLKDDDSCTRCALCAERCPTGAITMEAFRFQETLTYA
jgi:NADPH-dependent glutamate synthase beta subunit-like oxidoreductase